MSYLGRVSKAGFLLTVLMIIIVGSVACTTGGGIPEEMIGNLRKSDIKVLRKISLNNLIKGYDSSVDLTVVEVSLAGGDKERRAFLTRGKNEVYPLGKLRTNLDAAPVETLFFQTGDERFAIVWVDESIEGRLDTVTLGRPEMLPSDDSMRVLRVGAVDNRVAILPFFSDEIDLWDQINLLLIDDRGIGFAWDQQFEPPIDMRSQTQYIALP